MSRDQHSLVKFTTIVKYDGAHRAPRGNIGEKRTREGGKAGRGEGAFGATWTLQCANPNKSLSSLQGEVSIIDSAPG